ncbi:hypothetical protein ACU6XY_09630 [Klebsiella aerogenes]
MTNNTFKEVCIPLSVYEEMIAEGSRKLEQQFTKEELELMLEWQPSPFETTAFVHKFTELRNKIYFAWVRAKNDQ